jgi:hypothetical protein
MQDNRLRNIVIIGAAAIVLVAVIAGILIYITASAASVVADETVVKDNVSTITSEDDAEKQPAEVTDDGLIFAADPRYPNGEVLVAGIIDTAPNGFIRKVVDTSQEDGKYIVRTEPAAFTDVFERARIAKFFALTEEGAVEIDPGSRVSAEGELSVSAAKSADQRADLEHQTRPGTQKSTSLLCCCNSLIKSSFEALSEQ